MRGKLYEKVMIYDTMFQKKDVYKKHDVQILQNLRNNYSKKHVQASTEDYFFNLKEKLKDGKDAQWEIKSLRKFKKHLQG